jgi:hypothetical protein
VVAPLGPTRASQTGRTAGRAGRGVVATAKPSRAILREPGGEREGERAGEGGGDGTPYGGRMMCTRTRQTASAGAQIEVAHGLVRPAGW